MKIKKIISYLLSIILVILFIGIIILFILNIVVFNKENIKKQISNVDYYTEINNLIKETSNNYIMQSGFDENIIDNVITKEKVESDVNKLIAGIYNGEEVKIDTTEIKTNLDKNIQEYVNKNNYKITDENKKDIEQFEDKILSIYENNITYSKNGFKKVTRYYKIGKRASRICLVILAIATIILAIIVISLSRPGFGVSLISTGIICIFVKCYSSISVAVNNILIGNKALSNFIINLINQMISYFFICGIISTLLGILIIVFSERKIYKKKYDENNEETEK